MVDNFRKIIIDELLEYAKNDSRIILLAGDMGFGAIDNFCKICPKQFINMGIMEQGMVGVAAGMAMSGLIPVVYTMVNFLSFRALEQIRNDVILQDLNVKFIGTGANNYFEFLGKSHCCGDDDMKIMEIINMPVYDPYSCKEDFKTLVYKWINNENATYIRV